MGSPDVSVIMPTYRREHEVVEAIGSALQQRGVTVEVLVYDDTPEATARTAVESIGDPRVRYVARAIASKGRPAIVRNEAIKEARGRYIYGLDDDDRVAEGALQAMVEALDARPDTGVAFGRVVPFGCDEAALTRYREWFHWAAAAARRVGPSSWLTVGTILFRGTVLLNSACMMRRGCAEQLGGYDADLGVYEDVDFYLRGIRRFGHVFVDVDVLHYRTGAPSLIHNLPKHDPAIANAYRRIFDKYRRDHGAAEFYALKVAAKLVPLPAVPIRT